MNSEHSYDLSDVWFEAHTTHEDEGTMTIFGDEDLGKVLAYVRWNVAETEWPDISIDIWANNLTRGIPEPIGSIRMY
jgi:hypothetical protein